MAAALTGVPGQGCAFFIENRAGSLSLIEALLFRELSRKSSRSILGNFDTLVSGQPDFLCLILAMRVTHSEN